MASAGTRGSLRAELVLRGGEELVEAPGGRAHILSRALARLVRSPLSMKTRTTASATMAASSGLTMTPVSRAKSLWPVNAASMSRNQMPGSRRNRLLTSTAWKPMSLVSSSTGMTPAPS